MNFQKMNYKLVLPLLVTMIIAIPFLGISFPWVWDTATTGEAGTPTAVPPTATPTSQNAQFFTADNNDDAYESQDNANFNIANPQLLVGSDTIIGSRWDSAVIIRNVTIPQGATITNATWRVEAANVYTSLDSHIFAYDADSHVGILTDVTNLTHTTANVAFDVGAVVADDVVTSDDISVVIQEIVDRPGWVSGSEIVIIMVGDNAAATTMFFKGASTGDDNRPELDVTWTP